MKVNQSRLYGSIIGDIAGSVYEFKHNENYNCELFPVKAEFTDDTIMTVATAQALLSHRNFAQAYREWGRNYPSPMGGYGGGFSSWLFSDNEVGYNSMGNGSAMRVSPVAYASGDWNVVCDLATKSSACTHSHWQGIRAAQAVARCIFLLNHGSTPEETRETIINEFGYDIPSPTCPHDVMQTLCEYSELAQNSVPFAIWCALSATSFEDAIRRAISLGGDADTIGCITGSIAECIHEIPQDMLDAAKSRLTNDLLVAIELFNEMYN